MKKFSLNRRLIFAVVTSQVLLAIGLAIIGTSFSRHYLRRAFDVYLEGRAQSVAALVYYPDDGSHGLLFNEEKIPQPPGRQPTEVFLVTSDHGDFERHTSGYDSHVFDSIPKDARLWNLTLRGTSYRAIVLRDVAILDTEEGIPQPLPKLIVIYAAPATNVENQVTRLALEIGIVSVLILAPTLIFALWNIRKALTPLHDLTAAAGEISAANWRFEPSETATSTVELEPLIAAVTNVLAGLEAAFKRQRDFLGDAAHELKTSLAILKSSVQALLIKPRQPGEYENGLLLMTRDCERLERLLNRMLQTARAEQRIADGQSPRPELTDLASSCESAIVQLAQFAETREIRINFNASGQAHVRAEKADLELIWTNLIENAIQYSSRCAKISIRLSVHSEIASVQVSDEGCGIEPAHLPYIFERFYRADSSRARSTGGFGLGLAIAKSLVTYYGGQIRAESEPGCGTSILVEFPVESTSPPADLTSGPSQAPSYIAAREESEHRSRR